MDGLKQSGPTTRGIDHLLGSSLNRSYEEKDARRKGRSSTRQCGKAAQPRSPHGPGRGQCPPCREQLLDYSFQEGQVPPGVPVTASRGRSHLRSPLPSPSPYFGAKLADPVRLMCQECSKFRIFYSKWLEIGRDTQYES